MTQEFIEKYGKYEEIPLSKFKLIPEVSTTNYNYYIGIDRGDKHDILFKETDEYTGMSDFYVVNNFGSTYIGFAYEDDVYITITDEYMI